MAASFFGAAACAGAATGSGAGAIEGRRDLGRGLAERALQFVQRHFAGAQFALQGLRHQRARDGRGGRRRRHSRGGRGRLRLGRRSRHRGHAALDHVVELHDQIFVGAFRLGFGGFQSAEDFLDAVDAGQDQTHRVAGDRHAVAEFAHQGLAGMGQRFQSRQSQKAARALDGVDEAEDVIQYLGVVRILLEPHQLIVDRVQALAGLGQKLPQ